MQLHPETTGGPTLWWVWGDLRQALSRLEQGQLDMRREYLAGMRRIDQRLDSKRHGHPWLAQIPWYRIAMLLLSALGTLGYIKPQWVKLLTGG
jgi:hypothetical protein